MKTFAIILFVLTYILIIVFQKWRPWIALASAVVFIASGILPLRELGSAIDWNILMMLAGTMGTVSLFIESRMPNRMSDLLLQKTPNVMWAVVALSLFAGIVSAFVDNVATVLMIAPVGLAIAKRLDISPVPLLVTISVSSNLQGAATLVGDTTSILLGSYANMDFMDFLFMDGKPSIFWAVELGALATVPVIMLLFRREKGSVPQTEPAEVQDYFPSWLLGGNILLLIGVSFIPGKPAVTNGLICLVVFLIGAVRSVLKTRSATTVKKALLEIDYATLLLLTGLFIVIRSVARVGLIEDLSQVFVSVGGGSIFLLYTLIVWFSVLISAFIDNIPYVATMLPVVSALAAAQGCSPYVLFFGLLVGATLGGNLTPIGASANIAAIGILQKNDWEVKTGDFMRIGIPFTLIAVLVGYLFCWLVWA